MGSLRDDLSRIGVLRETHISWVFLAERDAWKIKKPVNLGFLDFSSPSQRWEACVKEVRLNRRLAPSIYHGVVPITRDRSGQHHIDGVGETVDWAVHMVRLPDHDRADRRLAQGRLDRSHIDQLVDRLAAFHKTAQCDDETSRFGLVTSIAANVRENFEQTRSSVTEHLSDAEATEIETWQRRFLVEHAMQIEERVRAGRVRDGHGDLRLEQIYIDAEGSVTILDCIEFNERFRFADVAADIAFLSMDLTFHGRADLAEYFLARYAQSAGDYRLYPLIDFYESYRAYIRGKVSSMLAADGGAALVTRDRAAREARRYFLLALAAERRALVPPVVVAVGGVTATGKSTVAAGLAYELGAPVVDSDHTRKQLLDVPATRTLHAAPWCGAYDPAVSDHVYEEMMRRARAVLHSGRAVVLDASFRTAMYRRMARALAREFDIPFRFVECTTTRALCAARLRARETGPSVSDGRLHLLDEFIAHFEAVNELSDEEQIVIDTAEPLSANLDDIHRAVVTWPAGLAV